MKRSLERLSLLTFMAIGSGAVIGCSGSGGAGAPGGASAGQGAGEATGTVGAQLQIGGGITIAAVTYGISGPNGFVKTGTVDLSHASALAFTVGGLPAGTGYSITLSAVSVDGATSCAGTGTFNVSAKTTTQVMVHLECHQEAGTGAAGVIGSANVCPLIDSVSTSPSAVFVGGTIALSSAAHDPDMGPSPLSYQWTATSGSFDNAASQNPTFTCMAIGSATLTLTVSDGDTTTGCPAVLSVQVTCDSPAASDAGSDATISDAGSSGPVQALFTTVDPGVTAVQATINQGTAVGEGAQNGATPFTLTNLAADPNNTQTSTTNDAGDILASGTVPDPAFGFCSYPDGGSPARISYVTGAKFESSDTDPRVPMAPFYFPLVYNSSVTVSDHGYDGTAPPIVGLFDWRPKDIDEALVVGESDDNGKSWYFMQTVLELNPDYTNPISGGFTDGGGTTGCPATVHSTHGSDVTPIGSNGDDGWGHATIIQLPGSGNGATGQYLYMLNRDGNPTTDGGTAPIDFAPLEVINIAPTPKFPIINTNNTNLGANDIKSITSALSNTPGAADAGNAVTVMSTGGLLNPDGIMAVFPTSADAGTGTAVTVLYVQKILNGDSTGSTALPAAQRCNKAPFSGKTNHDISNVRLATTIDGVNFTDLGIVQGLSDPTTVDYNQTRWISPRATVIDINGDQSLWGMYFAGGNCLDGDSDAFHYIGYAESADMMHWTVYNDINHPIASINPITATNQAGGATVTIPANPPIVPMQAWFAERLYAPTATRIDATHLSLTFAGYGAQTPNNDLLNYRAIGNVVLTVSKPLPAGVPNNVNAH